MKMTRKTGEGRRDRPSRPQIMTRVVEAVRRLRDGNGPTEREIVHYIRQNSRGSPRVLPMQVQKALKHAVLAGILRTKSGRYKAMCLMKPLVVDAAAHPEEKKEPRTPEKPNERTKDPPGSTTKIVPRASPKGSPKPHKRHSSRKRRRSTTRKAPEERRDSRRRRRSDDSSEEYRYGKRRRRRTPSRRRVAFRGKTHGYHLELDENAPQDSSTGREKFTVSKTRSRRRFKPKRMDSFTDKTRWTPLRQEHRHRNVQRGSMRRSLSRHRSPQAHQKSQERSQRSPRAQRAPSMERNPEVETTECDIESARADCAEVTAAPEERTDNP